MTIRPVVIAVGIHTNFAKLLSTKYIRDKSTLLYELAAKLKVAVDYS